MKKILTVSLLAVMAVSGARADIASTTYVDDVAATKQNTLEAGAYTTVQGNKVNVTVDGSVEQGNTGLVTGGTVYSVTSTKVDQSAYDTKMGELDQSMGELDQAIEKIQGGQLNITAGAVGTTELKNDAVTADKIADNAVDSSEIAENAVDSSEIAENEVGSSEIAAEAVGTSEIANGSVALADLNDEVMNEVDGKINTKVEALDVADTAVAGQYVSSVSEANGIITPARVAFDEEVTAESVNAPTSAAVAGYVGSAVSTINSNIAGKQIKSTADFQVGGEQGTWFNLTDSLPAGCKAANSECSLVSVADAQGNVQIKWSVVVKGNPASADIAVVTPTERVSD